MIKLGQVMLTWLADVLRAEGCRVIEEPGWKTRGRPSGAFDPKAVMLHHDASPAGETSGGVDVIRDGRPGLEGPLAQLWLAFDGTWHVVAAGRANHAGEGGPWGVISADDGNADAIGIETDHTTDEDWSGGQRSSGLAGVGAICRRLGITTTDQIGRAVCAHKEYAAGRKVDPDPLNMKTARANLADYLSGNPSGGGVPVKTDTKTSSLTRTLISDEWRDLRFSDDDDDPTGVYAVGRGPAAWFILTAEVYAEGPPGASFYLRPYKDAGEDDTDLYPMRQFVIPAGGVAHVDLSEQGHIGDDAWLRVMGRASGGTVNLTATRGELAMW